MRAERPAPMWVNPLDDTRPCHRELCRCPICAATPPDPETSTHREDHTDG